ncbi:hypothetical protein [Streptomyces flaveolus]|uniref:hypothetical protein n=1 Tax=Streptomyces flaveolus TaxID=67297 RepID=UPI0038109AF7
MNGDRYPRNSPARPLSIRHTAISGIRVVAMHGEIDHAVKDMSSETLPSYDGAEPKPTRRPCVRGCP